MSKRKEMVSRSGARAAQGPAAANLQGEGVSRGREPPRMSSSADERRHKIAEAAYYRALVRGFAPGREMDDWLEAEVEIDRVLHGVFEARPDHSLKG